MVLREERTGIDKKFFELCSKVVEGEGLKVYDMDYLPGSHELRLYIQDPETGSAVIEDCIKVDKAMTPFIDEEEWMPSELTLEVSSPGVYRNLTSLDHFQSCEGELLQLTTKQKLGDEFSKKLKGQKKFLCRLIKANEDGIEVELDEKNVTFKYEEIKKANLEVELA